MCLRQLDHDATKALSHPPRTPAFSQGFTIFGWQDANQMGPSSYENGSRELFGKPKQEALRKPMRLHLEHLRIRHPVLQQEVYGECSRGCLGCTLCQQRARLN